ncbi:WSSV021 [White spot syndrome virus]|uniref:WSSV021 n=1 Tax=White spot syndrome virus TaxID=342409 RepID=A0A2I6SBG3_9VIRU|nr:WSSV021 [White spot syndrome virus]
MSNGATISDERLILILDKIVERRGVSNLSELLIHPITKHINELLKNTVRHGDRVYMKDAELDVRSRLEDIKRIVF